MTPDSPSGSVGNTPPRSDPLKQLLPALSVFFWSRLAVIGCAYVALLMLPVRDPQLWRAAPDNLFIDWVMRWDSGWYGGIVDAGYTFKPGGESNVAFFPVLPLLLRAVEGLGLSRIYAGFVLSNVAFCGALVLVYQWILHRFQDVGLARRALWLLALQPAAVFFSALYTESLFLCLIAGAFLAAEKRRWFVAGCLGLVASGTRVTGILVWGGLILLWLEAQDLRLWQAYTKSFWVRLWGAWRAQPWAFLSIQLAPLGLVAYMLYLGHRFGDPLAFLHAQAGWGRQVQMPWVSVQLALQELSQVDWTAGTIAGEPWRAPIRVLDVALSLGAVGAAIWLCWRVSLAYGLFVLVSVLVPLATHTVSMTRYIAVLFPVFLVVALWTRAREGWWTGLLVSSSMAAALCSALFALWYFVG